MLGRGHRQVSDGVALGASYKLMPVGEQLMDELAAGIVGVCHQQNTARKGVGDGKQKYRQLVEQGSGIAVGEDESFVNPRRQGHSGHMSGSALDQQRNGLKRMARDLFRIGSAVQG